MKTLSLSGTDLTVPNIILGLLRIADLSDEAIRTLVRTAMESGVTYFDHADTYGVESYSGPLHVCEKRFAEALQLSSAEREKLIIQTKCGNKLGSFDFSAEHLLAAANGSLKALRTDYIDVLLLHRPDALVEPEEVARAFDDLYNSGKVRHFGVSNHTPGQIELLKKYVTRPIIINQVQLSLTHCPIIATGLAANMQLVDQSIDRDNGLLDYSRLHDITLQAWSPFQRYLFDGTFLGDRQNYAELNDIIDRLAAKYAVPSAAIAVGWITRHPANMQVVLGTTRPQRVIDASEGSDVPLTREEWYELFTAAGHLVP